MDPETLSTYGPITLSVLSACTGPLTIGAIAAVWAWYTRVYVPAQRKEREISSAHIREQQRSVQTFDEANEKSALIQILENEKLLIMHLIESGNGHLGKLTEAVLNGNIDQALQAKEIIAALNEAIIRSIRETAGLPALRNIGDYSDAKEVRAASVVSAEVQRTDAIVEAATAQRGE